MFRWVCVWWENDEYHSRGFYREEDAKRQLAGVKKRAKDQGDETTIEDAAVIDIMTEAQAQPVEAKK